MVGVDEPPLDTLMRPPKQELQLSCAAITLTFFKKEDLDLSYHIKAVHMYRQLEKKERKKKGNRQRRSKGGDKYQGRQILGWAEIGGLRLLCAGRTRAEVA